MTKVFDIDDHINSLYKELDRLRTINNSLQLEIYELKKKKEPRLDTDHSNLSSISKSA
jgi:hypothetical protein